MPLDAYFAVNLRRETVTPDFQRAIRPRAYLAAPDYMTAALQQVARERKRRRYGLIADNGNFDEIGQIALTFLPKTKNILKQIARLEKQLTRDVRFEDVTPKIRSMATMLAQAVEEQAGIKVQENLNVQHQIELHPSAVVGMEDITAAIWLRLGIELHYISDGRSKLLQINRGVCQRARVALTQLQSSWNGRYLTVASALDYNSAFDAGVEFAAAGIVNVAMGFGAYMSDDSFTDYLVVDGRRHDLTFRVPMRYLRCALVARGFWDGYQSQSGHAPSSFHFLGLGSPIMIPVMSLISFATKLLTFDAVSPFKDAGQGLLYTTKPAYQKLRSRAIAFRLASKQGETWSCPCPFCKRFEKAYPADYKKGNNWYNKNNPEGVQLDDLRPGGPLYDAYPLLSEPKSGPRRTLINHCRIGHNHWILERIFEDVRNQSSQKSKLESAVDNIVEQYVQSTRSDQSARAVAIAFKIAQARNLKKISFKV